MGMYDDLQCHYPLPGTQPEFVKEFQTKSLDCLLDVITITKDGRLEEYPDFTGMVQFYGCNIVAAGPSGTYTEYGEDIESVTYLATFVDGKLTNIEQTHYEREPALSIKEMPTWKIRKKFNSELQENNSLIGQKLFVADPFVVGKGYLAEVVYETEKQLCVKDDKGNLILFYRWQVGNILFKNADEAKANSEFQKQQIQEEVEDYKKKLSEKLEEQT
jgi:hypothetical protein